jgi:pectate lyase
VLSAPSVVAATWFVATNGLDSNGGTSNSPFATIMRAQTAAASGDTVYLRGGTYSLNNSNLTFTNSPWVVVNHMTKSGISYIDYPNERPVFDFSAVQPIGWRVTAFYITNAANCLFRGFDVVGVTINIKVGNTQSECFRVNKANNNRFEQLRMHDGMGIGWYLTDGASNLVLNCDAYNNVGLETNSFGNIDGFGCHPSQTNGTGNVLRGCRAWVNSDDGYDCINAFAEVTFDHCWAFYNGYSNSPTGLKNSGGDGNGIKAGGYGNSGSKYPTNHIPHHVVEFCLAVGNRAGGFYANHHLDGQVWLNNTAYRNSTDYNMLCSSNNASPAGDVPGYNHVMKNNLGYNASSKETNNLNMALCDVSYNFFTLPVTVAANDFMTLDESLLTAPRQTNGDLPYIAFAQLVSTSDLVDAGTNVGFAFVGAAPDLGAFEYGIKPPPTLAMSRLGANLIFTGSDGPAGGPNYLVASTNLALPLSQWSRIMTNKFDLVGNYAFTNPIPIGVPQRFHRLRLP